MNQKITVCFTVSLILALWAQSVASAHFPWLVRGTDNKVQLFFGEGLNDQTYELPPAIAKAEIIELDEKGNVSKLSVAAVETDSFVGLRSTNTIAADRVLASSITYGAFRGSKLQYTALSFGKLPTSAGSTALPDNLTLQAKLFGTDSGISVLVIWEGKPLSRAKVTLCDSNAVEHGVVETDESGLATFAAEQVQAGLNAVRVGHKITKEGMLGDVAYNGEMHYLTATFTNAAGEMPPQFGALPFAITSFGAATDGKSLYVYGGHMGEAHSYAFEEQSDKLLRLDLSDDKRQWKELATATRLQGTAMVAYGDELVIVGGFQALNKAGEPKDLHSKADVLAYNTHSNSWSALPSLPEPRSSHDAAIVGSKLYVVGGWNMAGGAETQWHKTAWRMDLATKDRKWEPVAAPPFERRALAAIEHQNKLVVVGGMNREGGPTKAAVVFDPQIDVWSPLPDIQGEKSIAGFGTSGWSVNGKLILTSQEGKIEQLSEGTWKIIGETKDARFFHRILPVGDSMLVAIGGANMGAGKFTETEVIRLDR